ncbi:MAG: hypothetical protein R2849_00865 [Thermomicrobiales bacterium]
MTEERIAPHLAVGDDVDPGVDLQRDRFIDRPVFYLLERCVADLPGFELPACLR